MTSRSRVLIAALIAALTIAGALGSPALAQESPEPAGWIVVDVASGEVLAAHNEHLAFRPASTTKIMTALLAVERLDPAEPVVISEIAQNQPPSKIGALVGEEWPLETAIAGILMESANDLAYALAEAVGDGNLEQWVQVVNETAVRYGMQDSTFNDPAGFDAPGEAYGEGPSLSAYDIAIATRNAMAVPALAALAASASYEYNRPGTDTTSAMENHNKLLPGGERAYDGATGFKTGFTQAAGHTFVGTARRADRELIVVILDTYDFYGWAATLLDQGFATTPGEGTGTVLPDVAVEPFAQRQADLLSFTAAARGPAAATEESTDVTSLESNSAAPAVGAIGSTPGSGDAASASGDDSGDAGSGEVVDAAQGESSAEATGSTGGVSSTTIAAVVLVLLAGAFFLRRRQVQVRKRRRFNRQRMTAQAMRRGTLPTIDGRPNVHARASSPPRVAVSDSHIRLVPDDSGGRAQRTL